MIFKHSNVKVKFKKIISQFTIHIFNISMQAHTKKIPSKSKLILNYNVDVFCFNLFIDIGRCGVSANETTVLFERLTTNSTFYNEKHISIFYI